MRSFSSLVMEAPGDCSPSRRVVSKMISWSVMAVLLGTVARQRRRPGSRLRATARLRPLQARDDGLERGRDDVGIHADAEQRLRRRRAARGRRRPAHRRRRRSRARGSRSRAPSSPVALASPSTKASIGPLPLPSMRSVRPPTWHVGRAAPRRRRSACSSSWCRGAAMPPTPYSRSNSAHRSRAVSSLPLTSITRLHDLAELDLQAARQLEAVFALEQVGDAALARLAVDADHGLVAAAQVLRVDRQVGHVPDVAVLARREGLLDRVLVRARERGVDQVADVRMARMHRQLVAVLDRARGSRRCRRSRGSGDTPCV